MSLWKVPDQATAELMTKFYELLLAGEPPPEALRQAKIATRERYPDALMWGAFVCYGERRPIGLSQSSAVDDDEDDSDNDNDLPDLSNS